jgi:PAS domain S-box-containing protein
MEIILYNTYLSDFAFAHGFDYDDLKGRLIYDLFPFLKEHSKEEYEKVLTTGLPVIKEEHHVLDGADVYMEIRKIPVHDRGGISKIVTVIRDITRSKQFEKEREKLLNLVMETNEKQAQLNEELKRSNNDLQEFAYVASHDLQEPLRMVASYVQLLARRYRGKLDKDADEFINYAVEGAKRMQQLISDLLQWSRLGTRGKPFEETNLEDVFNRATANLKVAIDETNAKITRSFLPTLFCDDVQLSQLFQNLIHNSIKYRSDKTPEIQISVTKKNKFYEFAFSDNGIGIDPRYKERIFVIFQRLHTREEYKGTGIGLALCKKIVERHGGKIWVESQPGQGSTFYFTIPDGLENMPDGIGTDDDIK